jgi:hypothetical protein
LREEPLINFVLLPGLPKLKIFAISATVDAESTTRAAATEKLATDADLKMRIDLCRCVAVPFF